MPRPPGSSVAAATQEPHGLVAKLLRYFTGSVVAAVCSEAAFLLLYGALTVGTTWASILAWLAGAVPNFWLNRNWAWQRRGRPSLRHEVLPYVAIIVVTLALATVTTRAADRWLHHQGTSASVRVVVVAGVFFGVYVVVFALRFFLLERLFAPHRHPAEPTHEPTEGTR